MLPQLSALLIPFLLSERVMAATAVTCGAGTLKTNGLCYYCPAGSFNSRQYRIMPLYLTPNIIFVMQNPIPRPRAKQLAKVSRSPSSPDITPSSKPRRELRMWSTDRVHRCDFFKPVRRRFAIFPGRRLRKLTRILGNYQDATGQSSCKVCPAGSYCPDSNDNQARPATVGSSSWVSL
jgi:hypothetical protein